MSTCAESHSPPKTTPTDSAHTQDSYLVILPSPKATPPPEDLPSPTHSGNGPPVPPRRGYVRTYHSIVMSDIFNPFAPSHSTSSNPPRRPAHHSPSSPALSPSSLPVGSSFLSEDPPLPPPRSCESLSLSPHSASGIYCIHRRLYS